jgi:DNA-nicking Smr family endonuclease
VSPKDGDDDARAFEEATRGARPIARAGRVGRVPLRPAAPAGPPPHQPRATPPALDDDAAPRAPGDATFDVVVTGAAIAGRADGVDARVLRRLKAGELPVEARLDLHGRARVPALAALERFVAAARADGRRVVLVIHGRGAHSAEDGPVLKPLVWRWLGGSSAAARAVLAFASARPAQGGDGATLVLLRRA